MSKWLFALGLLAGLTSISLQANGQESREGLELFFIDVQGGAATLMVTPQRESVLIDSGWPGQDDRDPKRIEHVLKQVAKLEAIDHLVTTHWHTDHYGGVEGLVKRVAIHKFWDRGLPEDTDPPGDSASYPDGPKPDDPLGVSYRRASQGKRQVLKVGSKLPLRGEMEALVLASGAQVISSSSQVTNPLCASAPADLAVDRSDNAKSLAIRFRMGPFSFLDCGDLTWNVEKMLVCPVDLIGPIDVFQVTHHGLDSSNHPTLVQTIRPVVAITNNGPRKGGSAATYRLLKSVPSIQSIYQLHKNATTGAEDNAPPDRIANSDPKGGQFIRLSVAPDGKSYRVRIGADGPAQEFQTRGNP